MPPFCKSLVLLLFLSLLSSRLQGQAGGHLFQVLDANHNAVEYATVVTFSADNGAILETAVSDSLGFFKLNLNESPMMEVLVSHINYQDRRILVSSDSLRSPYVVSLVSTSINLDEVVLKASRKVVTFSQGQLIFNVRESRFKSGYDALELLERTPLISQDRGRGISLLGQPAIIQINGQVQSITGEDLMDYLESISSDRILKVEVDAMAGSEVSAETSGGIVNIVVREDRVGFFSTSRLDQIIRSLDHGRSLGRYAFDVGNSSWNLNGAASLQRNSISERTRSSIDYADKSELLNEIGASQDIQSRQNYRFGITNTSGRNITLALNSNVIISSAKSEKNNEILLSRDATGLEQGRAILNRKQNYIQTRWSATCNYVIDSSQSYLRFFSEYISRKAGSHSKAGSVYENNIFDDSEERFQTSNSTSLITLQADLKKKLGARAILTAGLRSDLTERNNDLKIEALEGGSWSESDGSNSFLYSEDIIAGYLGFSQNYQNFNLKAGIRAEATFLTRIEFIEQADTKQRYFQFFPYLNLSRTYETLGQVVFAYNRQLRRPSFRYISNYRIKLNDFRYELGNPMLAPEILNKLQVRLNREHQAILAYANITTRAINGIYFLEDRSTFYQRVNRGTQSEFGLSYNIFGNLNKWLFAKSDVRIFRRSFTDQDALVKFKRTTLSIRLNLNLDLSPRNTLFIQTRYRSRYEDAFYVSLPYYFLNVTFERRFLNNKLKLRLQINDVFNTLVYKNVRPFETFTSRLETYPQSQYLRLLLNYRFKTKKNILRRINLKNEIERRF